MHLKVVLIKLLSFSFIEKFLILKQSFQTESVEHFNCRALIYCTNNETMMKL